MALRSTLPTLTTNAVAAKLGRTNIGRSALGEVSNKNKFSSGEQQIVKQPIKKEETKLVRRPLKTDQSSQDENSVPNASALELVLPVRTAFSSQLLGVPDIDVGDGDNPQLVSELVNDIYDYMRELERKYTIRPNFLQGTHTTSKMRSILVDWLIQVHARFQLLQETLFLTVAIIDRFLQEEEVNRARLQLVGVASMFLAAKYEEMYPPEIGDFSFITDNSYTNIEIRRMECYILKTLNFSLGRPLPLHFLRRNSKACNADALLHTVAKYIMELILPEYNMAHYAPSKVAAAALCLSMKLLGTHAWTKTVECYSQYHERELIPIMRKMAAILAAPQNTKLRAVREKYAGTKFNKVSSMPELKSLHIEKIIKELLV